MQTVLLKEHPEVKRLILAASPNYKKHKALIRASATEEIQGTYWSGGSRATYTTVDMKTLRSKSAPQFDPPQFGGPAVAPVVDIPPGTCIVQTGVFCGKTATAIITVHPDDMARLLTAPKT